MTHSDTVPSLAPSPNGWFARWQAQCASKRWALWWCTTLDSGRLSQDIWKPADRRMWSRALGHAKDISQPLPQRVGASVAWMSRSTQTTYDRLNLAGYTPLALALRLRDPALFQGLLDAGANPCAPAIPEGNTALEILHQLGEAYRDRCWSTPIGGATPQPWHSLLHERMKIRNAL